MPKVIKVKPFFTDERGEMSYLLDKETKFTSAVLITCKNGSIRANHYHKKDTHYCYMLKGKMEYSYKDINKKNARKKSLLVVQGETICTPPLELHAMRFLEDSAFIALTTESREQKNYEKDTVRIKLFNE